VAHDARASTLPLRLMAPRPMTMSTKWNTVEELRAAGSHPIVRAFPEGAIIVFDDDLRYLCAGGNGLSTVGLTQAMVEGKTIVNVQVPPA
jgi:hypothetical protein